MVAGSKDKRSSSCESTSSEESVEDSNLLSEESVEMSNLMPPKLDLTSTSYEFWRNQLKSWQALTDIKKEKWGHLLIYHSCDQKLQEELYASCAESALIEATGLELVLTELDKKYKVDDKLKQYLYFDELIEYKRLDEPIQEYIDEFERRVRKLKAVNCELPDPVLAHSVMKNANLSEEARATIKASATDFSYKQMKESMLRVYCKTFGAARTEQAMIKQEVCMYNSGNSGRGQTFRNKRGRGNGRQEQTDRQGYSDDSKRRNRSNGYKNPIDPKTGKPFLCFNCEADDHMSRYCPKPRRQEYQGLGKRQRSSFPTYFTEDDNGNDQSVELNLMDLAGPSDRKTL